MTKLATFPGERLPRGGGAVAGADEHDSEIGTAHPLHDDWL